MSDKWQRPMVWSTDDRCLSEQVRMAKYLPPMDIVPSEFKGEYGQAVKWCEVINDFFFSGAENIRLTCRDGITQGDVLRHLNVILPSWEPSHEHKMAACAWLLSLWVTRVEYACRPHIELGVKKMPAKHVVVNANE